MKKLFSLLLVLAISLYVHSQQLPAKWEELTASDFPLAVENAQRVCIVPMGVLEKHGPHLPLGTDVYRASEMCRRAAEKEYCVVFPDYYVGQIFEAQHQPGTLSYSAELIYKMLDETCREIARNGMKKIILVNTHGGNNAFLQYFCQSQMATPRDFMVYVYQPQEDDETKEKIAKMRISPLGGHADEVESGEVLAIRPDIVKIDRAPSESGEDMNRLGLKNVFTGIWWYAKFPNHYSGDAAHAVAELGEVRLDFRSSQLAEVIKAVKADQKTILLQNEFYKESASPLDTKAKR